MYGQFAGCPAPSPLARSPFTLTRLPDPSILTTWELPLRPPVGVATVASAPTVRPWPPIARWPGAPGPWCLVLHLRLPPPVSLPSCPPIRHPEVTFGRPWFARPEVFVSGTARTFADAKPLVKRYFRIPRVVPRTFRFVHKLAWFIHRSCTGSPTVLGSSGALHLDVGPRGRLTVGRCARPPPPSSSFRSARGRPTCTSSRLRAASSFLGSFP